MGINHFPVSPIFLYHALACFFFPPHPVPWAWGSASEPPTGARQRHFHCPISQQWWGALLESTSNFYSATSKQVKKGNFHPPSTTGLLSKYSQAKCFVVCYYRCYSSTRRVDFIYFPIFNNFLNRQYMGRKVKRYTVKSTTHPCPPLSSSQLQP